MMEYYRRNNCVIKFFYERVEILYCGNKSKICKWGSIKKHLYKSIRICEYCLFINMNFYRYETKLLLSNFTNVSL